MPYARFDDRYDDHKKIKKALRKEPAAVALHAMAITYCNRHNTDGDVDVDWVEEKLALMPFKPAQRKRVVDVLIECQLLEAKDAETYIVHDFLDWNLSSTQRKALADQGRRGGHAKAGRSSHPDGSGSGPGRSEGQSEGFSEGHSPGSSHPGNGGSSTPTPTPTPRQAEPVARKRATRRVDQSKRPDNFPEPLVAVGGQVLALLRGVWDIRGGVEPQPRGVGLAIMRNERADHLAVARKLEHWLVAGKGQRARCDDIAARYGDWVAEEDAAQKPGGSVHQLSEKQQRSERRLAAFNRVITGDAQQDTEATEGAA